MLVHISFTVYSAKLQIINVQVSKCRRGWEYVIEGLTLSKVWPRPSRPLSSTLSDSFVPCFQPPTGVCDAIWKLSTCVSFEGLSPTCCHAPPGVAGVVPDLSHFRQVEIHQAGCEQHCRATHLTRAAKPFITFQELPFLGVKLLQNPVVNVIFCRVLRKHFMGSHGNIMILWGIM